MRTHSFQTHILKPNNRSLRSHLRSSSTQRQKDLNNLFSIHGFGLGNFGFHVSDYGRVSAVNFPASASKFIGPHPTASHLSPL